MLTDQLVELKLHLQAAMEENERFRLRVRVLEEEAHKLRAEGGGNSEALNLELQQRALQLGERENALLERARQLRRLRLETPFAAAPPVTPQHATKRKACDQEESPQPGVPTPSKKREKPAAFDSAPPLDPPMAPHVVQGQGIIAVLTGFGSVGARAKRAVEQKLRALGACIKTDGQMTSYTHVIVPSRQCRTPKVLCASLQGQWVVTADWLDHVNGEENCLPAEDPFGFRHPPDSHTQLHRAKFHFEIRDECAQKHTMDYKNTRAIIKSALGEIMKKCVPGMTQYVVVSSAFTGPKDVSPYKLVTYEQLRQMVPTFPEER